MYCDTTHWKNHVGWNQFLRVGRTVVNGEKTLEYRKIVMIEEKPEGCEEKSEGNEEKKKREWMKT